MIGLATAAFFSLLCACTRALPHGTSKDNTAALTGQRMIADRGYVYTTITAQSTTTHTSTIFISTLTSHSAENGNVIAVTKPAIGLPELLPGTLAVPDVKDHVNQLNAEQTSKQKSTLQVISTIPVTRAKTPQNSIPALAGEYQAVNQNAGGDGSEIVKTVMHTIFNTVTAKKRPPPVTKFITVTHTTGVIGEPATILTELQTVTDLITNVVPTKTVTSIMKFTTEANGKKDIILWEGHWPNVELFHNRPTPTPISSPLGTKVARAVPTAPKQTGTTLTKTYTLSSTVYTTKTITIPGTGPPRASSTTTMTIPATLGGGLEAVAQQINAVSVATETVIEPIVSTIADDSATSDPPPTTSIKTVDVTDVVTVSNHNPSTVTETKTHVLTSTIIPPISVVTQTTTITQNVTISGIYTYFIVQTQTG